MGEDLLIGQEGVEEALRRAQAVPEGHDAEGTCEVCWNEAFRLSRTLGGSQVDRYKALLREHANG